MVRHAVLKGISEKVEILTNASLLTPQLSNKLISAGLDRLVISIQGTTEKKYVDVSHAHIDFTNFIRNIRYFYNRKKKTVVHIKIIDIALDDEGDKKRFYKIFGNICDTIGIEHASPIFPGVEYNRELAGSKLTQFGLKVSEVQVCPQPFFTMQINPDGNVVPCYSVTYPAILGNCLKKSLREIWNGNEYRTFRKKMLNGAKSVCKLCANCGIVKHRLFPEDNINKDAKRLMRFYN
jgi:radical SAM protein with 4Fe4S-binding SPASM domain